MARLVTAVGALMMIASMLVACGGEPREEAAAAATSEAITEDTTAPAPPTSSADADGEGCREPSGTEKASLRFAVRAHDRDLKDAPWALVRSHGSNFMAAEVAGSTRLVVLVKFPEEGGYLSAMKALNGTARTLTDLPSAGDRLPSAAEQALACMA